MVLSAAYPFEAIAVKRYKSPHKNDLSFAKGDRIRVTAAAPKEEDDEDEDDEEDDAWLIGESLDGTKSGTFPASHVQEAPAAEPASQDDERGTEATPALAGAAVGDDIPVAPAATEATGSGRHEPTHTPQVSDTPSAATASKDAHVPATITEDAELDDVDKKLDEAAADPTQDVEKAAAPALATSSTSKAAGSTPSRKQSGGPPPAAPKPSALAARIAAFNKPAEGPPPLPRGKPGAWKKPAAPAPVPAQKPTSASQISLTDSTTESNDASAQNESQASKVNSGFSAADAQTSIKMSLKERMAALQRGGGNEGSGAGPSSPEKPRAPPKPAPGRIAEDRRAAALSSFGASEPATSPDVEREEPAAPVAVQQTEDAPLSTAEELSSEKSVPERADPVVDEDANKDAGVDEVQADDAATNADQPEEEKTEEEQESERRAAIARRMAALGGRRMGGGPALFGAPAPPGPKPARKATGGSIEGVGSAEPPALLEAPSATSSMDKAEEEPTTSGAPLAVPRRAAPPRKKKGSASGSSMPAAPEVAAEGSGDSILMREGSGTSAAEKKASFAESDSKSIEAAALVGAGSGQGLSDEEHMTAEPLGAIVQSVEEDSIIDAEDASTVASQQAPSLAEPPRHGSTEATEDDRVGGAPAREPEEDDYMKVRVPSSRGTDTFEPSTPVSQGQLEEHARQLEAFVRHQDEEEEDEGPAEGARASPEPLEAMPERSAITSPPPPVAAAPRPPSARPPSARPPVPKTSKASSGDDEESADRVASSATARITSPPPATRPPPVPQASMRQASTDEEADGSTGKSSLAAGAATLAGAAGLAAAGAKVVAPKPRAAVPQELSDDEADDGQEDAAEMLHEQDNVAPSTGARDAPPIAEIEETKAAEEEPVDEEDSERLRRARLAERMARMGAQPIMGAPMPFRKKAAPVAEPAEEEAADAEIPGIVGRQASSGADDATDLQDDIEAAPEGSDTPPPLAAARDRSSLASPPPLPTSPPPPIARRQGSSGGQSMTKRASSSGGSLSGEMTGLQRDGSSRGRPPVPMTQYSTDDADRREDAEDAASTSVSPPARAPMSPPPRVPAGAALRAPMSPPPRAPPQRPAVSMQDGMTQDDEDGEEQEEDAGPPNQHLSSSSAPLAPAAPITAATGFPQSTSTSSLKGVQPSAPSPRDLDLMPSSQWWRHGLPVKLPPTLLRPDVVPTVFTQDEGRRHLIRVDLLFEDYSSTVVTVLFQDDDAAEQHTEISQQHRFAPGRPNTQQLQQWSQQYGSAIAKQASAILAAKGNAPLFGDGTSRGFVTALVAFSTNEACLPPVGSSFGAIILAQAATTIVNAGADEIRPGDVVALHGTDFKGKRGLASYHTTYGSANSPTYACIIESDTSASNKKRKLRCILVGGSGTTSNNSNARPEETSLRLDDVRSGLLRVFRVAPREGWLPSA